jgi:hypothetical protein
MARGAPKEPDIPLFPLADATLIVRETSCSVRGDGEASRGGEIRHAMAQLLSGALTRSVAVVRMVGPVGGAES